MHPCTMLVSAFWVLWLALPASAESLPFEEGHRLRNFTLTRRSEELRDSSVGRVLLLVTAAIGSPAGSDHLGDLYHLWPVMLRKNPMLRSADILMHIGVSLDDVGSPRKSEEYFLILKKSVVAFPNSHIRVFFVENLGYHPGAIKAMLDGAQLGWFNDYDW